MKYIRAILFMVKEIKLLFITKMLSNQQLVGNYGKNLLSFCKIIFFSNRYDDIIDKLYEEEIIDNNDLSIIQNEYSSYKSKDDGFER